MLSVKPVLWAAQFKTFENATEEDNTKQTWKGRTEHENGRCSERLLKWNAKNGEGEDGSTNPETLKNPVSPSVLQRMVLAPFLLFSIGVQDRG